MESAPQWRGSLASRGADIAVLYAGNQELAERVCGECRERYGVRAGSYRCDVADFEAATKTVAQDQKGFRQAWISLSTMRELPEISCWL